MQLRPYQQKAVDAVFSEWDEYRATLVVHPTGTGKTVLLGEIIRRCRPKRAMVVAHRDKLISQAVATIERMGVSVDVEMAEYWSRERSYNKADCVVSTVQTQNAGGDGDGRMARFDPQQFGLLAIDEAHHATASTYRKVIEHYSQNPDLKIVGLTATPDRADETALGKVFGSVADVYEIIDAIEDGWLVPISQQSVSIEELDFSHIATLAGDFNEGQLSAALQYEKPLHGMADATLRLAGDRKTLVFAASVGHAQALCDIFNRHKPACARFIYAATPRDERDRLYKDYRSGKFQLLCNVGIATEGFDEPGIEVVSMCRPTKSRCLYAQMAGRGTRALPGLVDGQNSPADRKSAIAASAKPGLLILDFVGNAGRHRLVTAADILGGKYNDEVVELASANMRKSGVPADVASELRTAESQIKAAAEKAKVDQARKKLVGKARFRTAVIDPFGVLGMSPPHQYGWDTSIPATVKQLSYLNGRGVDTVELSKTQASQLIGTIIKRFDEGKCTFKQAKLIKRFGYDTDCNFKQASQIITALKENGWKKPDRDPALDFAEEAVPF